MTTPFAHGRSIPTHMGYTQEAAIAQQMRTNSMQMLVLTPEDFMSIVQEKARSPATIASVRSAISNTPLAQYWKSTVYPNASNVSWVQPSAQSVVDVMLIAKVTSALGYRWTKIVVKPNRAGNLTIILKGDPTVRKAFLQGTTFLTTNAKMIQLGIGVRGTTSVAVGGFVLGLVVSVGIESLNYILDDQKTMLDLVGAIGVEAVKSGLAIAAGIALGAVVGLSGVAVLPLIVVAGVTLGVGIGLNILDNEFGIKEKVIRALKDAAAEINNSGVDAARFLDNGVKAWIRRGY
jgi:hypothetical protein